MNWFKSWFNSPYYHLLYQNRNDDEAKQFMQNLLHYFQPQANAKVLDLACGKGRHSKYLAENKLDVTGIDLSPESIKAAKAFEQENLHFYEHDMRTVLSANYFDYVFSLFTSMGYFTNERDDLKQFDAMHKALKSGGSLLIDFFNVNKVAAELKPFYLVEQCNLQFEITKKIEDGFIKKTIVVKENGEVKMQANEMVRMFDLPLFTTFLKHFNFEIKNVFGNYQLEKWNENTADRLIIHAVKK